MKKTVIGRGEGRREGKRMEKIWVKPSDWAFSYEGRIDFEDPQAPVFVYPCSHFKFRISGRFAALAVVNRHSYFENTLGVLVDGAYRVKILLHDGESLQGETLEQFSLRMEPKEAGIIPQAVLTRGDNVRMYDLSPFLDGKEHELTIFKRMDACHYFTFLGLITEQGGIVEWTKKPSDRRIEVYGDSISCGEVSEAVACCGSNDPEGHNGIYSNSFYSYPWILARMLGASLHDVAQGGISLRDGEGYFDMPNTKGMLSCFDKIQNNPSLGERKQWDFSKYVPQVVIVAIGQNDAHPEDFMAREYDGEKAQGWRRDYAGFLNLLREKYPKALIVLSTTILGHDPAWDRAIGQVCEELGDPKVVHFTYSKNGCGTSGHVRIPEAEQMAKEMKDFLDSFGNDVWKDESFVL